MKRFLGIAVAMFFALVAIALVGGDTGAVAGHGCHGRHRCHGRERCHGGLLAKHRAKKAAKCHGEEAPACESGCGEAACEGGCEGGCGEAVEGGCSSCGGGEVVSGGCVGGGCGGEAVISSGTPTEAAPAAPAALAASGT
jgi:hypothetical protein